MVSRRPEPDNAERPKGMIRCHTTLLDDTVFTCDIDVSVYNNKLFSLATLGVDDVLIGCKWAPKFIPCSS